MGSGKQRHSNVCLQIKQLKLIAGTNNSANEMKNYK